MSISKLNLSIINTFNTLAEDTSGLLLCCTNDDNGDPQIHRVMVTKSIIGLLCELRRPSARAQRRILYRQGIGWWSYNCAPNFTEQDVYVKVIGHDIDNLPSDVSLEDLRNTIVEHNLFTVEQALETIESENRAIQTEDLETLLQNLDDDGLDTLKSFVIGDENLCNEIIAVLMRRLKI